jgi:NADPH2:quinone reductase
MVSFGQSSGMVPPISTGILAQKGSLFLTRPSLATYVAREQDLLAATRELFDAILDGTLRIEIGGTYPLREAERAHRDLEGRKTTGSVVLAPGVRIVAA